LLKDLEGCALYVHHSLRAMLRTTGARAWQADAWKGRATSLALEGTKARVMSLRRVFNDRDDPETRYESLSEATTWLRGEGVGVGSISAMAWQLWRSTLTHSVDLSADPKVTRPAFYGPRQECAPGYNYHDHVSLDMVQAYPHSMAARPFAAQLREVSTSTTLDPERSGIARANITVPDTLPYPPLPVRLGPAMIHWQVGQFTGTWSWAELDAAKRLGCDVTVTRCWAPLNEVDLFGAWFDTLQRARATLSPGAVRLIKPVANSLWGMFGMSSDVRTIIRWRDDLGDDAEVIERRPRSMPQANTVHIAAEVTSRVRTRMLLEGLAPELARRSDAPVHVDTDGIIIPSSALKRLTNRPSGTAPGEWRVKDSMTTLEVRAPQLYRYMVDPRDGWHYVAAGLGTRGAADLFQRIPRVSVSLDGIDVVAPSGFAPATSTVTNWIHERQRAELVLWGPTMVDDEVA
jgi:hypothetical protein